MFWWASTGYLTMTSRQNSRYMCMCVLWQRGESFSLPSHYALLKKGATMTIRVAEEPTGKRKRTAAEREETDLVWLYSGQNWAEESYCKATLLDEKGEDVYTYIMGPNERVVSETLNPLEVR